MVLAGKPQPSSRAALLLKLLSALLLAGGAYWVVRLQQLGRIDLPALKPAAESLPAPPPPLPQLRSFEEGLGIGLRIGARWDEVAAATSKWSLNWQPGVSGIGRERVALPGVAVGLEDGFVRGYSIELGALGRHNGLSQWAAQLRAMGLYPGLDYQTYSGGKGAEREESWLTSGQLVKLGAEEFNSAYCLVFTGGRLSELRGALSIPGSG